MSEIAFSTAQADIVFVNGKIVTINSNDDIAEALSIRHNRILRVGARAYVEKTVGPETRQQGSSLGLDNSRSDLFNPISELLVLGDLQAYRAAVPTHRRITGDPEITRDLRQCPIATSLH